MSKIERERRVGLSENQVDAVIARLDSLGATWSHVKRLMMDFSEGVSERTHTVMVRANNGVVEIVEKGGGIADAEREEKHQANPSIREAIEEMKSRGLVAANYGIRSMQECVIDGIEYSIRTIHDANDPETIHGYNFELELKKGDDISRLDKVIADMGLTSLTIEETKAMFERFHAEANVDFIYSEAAIQQIESLLEKWQ